MTITSQQYAALADDSYEDRYPVGVFAQGNRPLYVDPHDGTRYEILEHVNNRRTGYQGTVYRREDSGEIVVAHRGTEFDKAISNTREFANDVLRADGGMLLARANLQADDALALTERAKGYAEDYGARPGQATPEVTVTGHSLGGALAQVTAHRSGLRGETFNAFGAASLSGHGVPAGPNGRMTNHVMATDFVSAGAPQYGQVIVYAVPGEIEKLKAVGYADHLLGKLTPDQPVALALGSVGMHRMHHFTAVDAQGRADVSVLDHPASRRLAQQHAEMIGAYRDDIAGIRQGVTHSLGLPFQGIQRGLERLQEQFEESLRERFTPPPAAMPQVLPGQLPPGFPTPVYRPFGATGRPDEPTLPSLQSDPSAFLDRMLAAAQTGDAATFRQFTQAAAGSDAGRELREQAVATVDLQEQRLAEQQVLAQQQEPRAHVMRMG